MLKANDAREPSAERHPIEVISRLLGKVGGVCLVISQACARHTTPLRATSSLF